MALSASTVFEINQGATSGNLNGGGFNPANANMMTDLTTDANTANTNSPIVSSSTYTFVSGDAGKILYIKSGTNWTPGWYPIASVSGGKATLSAAIGQAIQTANNRYNTNTVAGCATVGTPTSGTFSIDYSQVTTSPFASTDIVVVSTTTLTSATNPFTKAMVGNLIHITAGTATAGWYEIVSVSGATATIDRSATTTGSGNTGSVGGALSLGSSDDAVFELAVSSATAAMRFFIKGNATYTMGGTVSIAAAGNSFCHCTIEGYASNRGDRPTGSARPLFACAANGFTVGNYWDVISLQCTITTAAGFTGGTGGFFISCKCINQSTTAGRRAFYSGGFLTSFIKCEAISYRGIAIAADTKPVRVIGCYAHDSVTGIQIGSGSAQSSVINCIIGNCKTSALDMGDAYCVFIGNTIYGAENKLGSGFLVNSTASQSIFYNNIVYGCVTGISTAGTEYDSLDDYNDYYNNTADITSGDTTSWQKGVNDIAVNPSFTSVTQRTGSTATTTVGNHLVQAGATFQTWGITAGVDYVYIVSGTGVTAGTYGILSVDSETQITADITLAADATANKVWSITQGHNFGVTLANTTGYPGILPGALSTGYLAIGAVQPQGSAGGSGGSFTFGS